MSPQSTKPKRHEKLAAQQQATKSPSLSDQPPQNLFLRLYIHRGAILGLPSLHIPRTQSSQNKQASDPLPPNVSLQPRSVVRAGRLSVNVTKQERVMEDGRADLGRAQFDASTDILG